MESVPGATPASHAVACFNCKAFFDAVEAAWCSCLVSRRTFVCPSCLSCFCLAPQTYKQGFWEGAPQALWDRVAEQHQPGFEAPAPPENPDSLTRPLVLLVEDDRDIQRMAVQTIESLGYGVVVARDGVQGLELARRLRPDLVLSDAMMPNLDGREMCLRIKQDPTIAGTPVVIMTSLYTASRYKYEAYKQFLADDYLAKPLDFKQLQGILRKFLDPRPATEAD